MTSSQLLVERLLQHRELEVRVSGSTIAVLAPSEREFAVQLIERGNEWVVRFDGWHEHFAAEIEAIDCFVFGLSGECRLRIEYRGSTAHRWTVEYWEANGWHGDSTVGSIFFPFWRRARTEYRQNAILPGNGGDFLK